MKRALVSAMVLFAGAALALTLRVSDRAIGRRALPHFEFTDAAGHSMTVDAFAGKVVLLDFWATWCVPCRNEMPVFDQLQARLGAKGLVIVPVSIDLNGMPAINAFYAETGIENLAKYSDTSRESAQIAGFKGIPSALLIDRRGREAARVEGPADWDKGRAGALLTKLLEEN